MRTCALDEALLLQIRQVLVDSCERGQPESSTDFFQARGVAVLLDEVVQVIQNLALAFRERKHVASCAGPGLAAGPLAFAGYSAEVARL